ncbi:MAG: LuxR C-terminal-related transcriptional regulator [Myxococcota bacterium]
MLACSSQAMGGYSLSARRLLGVLEAAYESGVDRWAGEVSEGILRAGDGAFASATLLSYRAAENDLRPLHTVPSCLAELLTVGQGAMSPDQIARVYGRRPVALAASEVFGPREPEAFRHALRGLGLQDFAGLTAPLGGLDSFSIGVGLSRDRGLAAPTRRRLAGLALHLGTVWRVRRAAEARDSSAPAPDADAPASALARHLDQALARAARVGGDDTAGDAVDAWDALLRQGWVVAHLDGSSARRRLILARIPVHPDAEPFLLTRREREVAERVASALSNKEVAYELGIPEASVATILARARKKLGVRSRLELVQMKRWLGRDTGAGPSGTTTV